MSVEIDSIVDLTGSELLSADLVILFDPAMLAVNSVSLGDVPLAHAAAGWSGPLTNIDNAAGRLLVGLSNQQGLGGRFAGSLVNIQFTVQPDAAAGATAINLVASITEPFTVTNLNEGRLTLVPAPTNAATDVVDGWITVLVPGWHNFSVPCDVTGDGQVTAADALAVINRLNGTPNDAALPSGVVPDAYYDVNNDRLCTPLDALAVINRLNTPALPVVEGEASMRPADVGPSPDSREDWLFRGLETNLSTLEGVLSDLADDVASAWR